MTLTQFLDHYGYAAVALGSFLEGDMVLILAGIAAKLGYLQLPWIVSAALIGTCAGDQLFFRIGRRHGQTFLQKRPHWLPRVEKVHRMLERHQILLIFGYRYLYGMRSVVPLVIGMSSIPANRFFFLDILGIVIWATMISSLGYVFGHGLELIVGEIRYYQLLFFMTIAVVILALWSLSYLQRRK